MASSSKKSPSRDKVKFICVLPSSTSFETQWFYEDAEGQTYGPYRCMQELVMDIIDADIVVEYTVERI